MIETSSLLANLAIALLVAAVAGIIAARLGQSVILGYIAAGILVGPHTPGWIADQQTVDALAAIGIVLLLFVTGMDVSVRELWRLGRVTLAGAHVQVLLMIGVGYLAGRLLGWPEVPSLFLGAVVSNSSSTVLSKVLAERGEGASRHGRIALAWSAVQDLTTIVLVVVLTAAAEGGSDVGSETAIAVGKAALFLSILVPLGSRLLPPLFSSLRVLRQREVFVLAAASLALLTAWVATLFGLSPALGAFVAGVVLSESEIRHEILNGIVPLRDIFAGLFFVSVGMLLEPRFVVEHPGPVLLALFLIIPVKGFVSAALSYLLGVSMRRSVLVGGGLAQSAEFSFLLASLGVTLAALSEDEFSVLLSATVVSVMLAPSILSASNRLAGRLEVVTHPWLTRELEREPGIVPGVAPGVVRLRDHVLVCGYGRVGRVVTRALREQGRPVAVIDLDVAAVVALRDEGIPAFLGTADNETLLERAGLRSALLLVIAVPERAVVRRLVVLANTFNPGIEIVARTHELDERDFLEANGVHEAVVGELELAVEMARFALARCDVPPDDIDLYLERARRDPLTL